MIWGNPVVPCGNEQNRVYRPDYDYCFVMSGDLFTETKIYEVKLISVKYLSQKHKCTQGLFFLNTIIGNLGSGYGGY